ncbi:MAG: HAD family hydrolase [Jatrophihabitans sp.]|nr:MAG: HAD family hydrolase [Jatrophihabitans sp.]
MTNPAVEAVLFDWGGTLTPWHTVDPLEAWLAAVGDADRARRLHAAENGMWQRSRDEHRSATLGEVFAAAGIDATPEVLAAFHAWWEPHTFLDPDAPAVLAGLRARGLKVGVLSNTIWPRSVHEQIFVRDEVADLIDGAVYTSEIAWTKPHPRAFRAALDAVGVADPAAAVFVGDRPYDDVCGAKAAGLRAVLVPHSDIPAEQVGPITAEPDAVVQRLADLLDVVDRWG